MSFFGSIKRLFGYDDYDEEDSLAESGMVQDIVDDSDNHQDKSSNNDNESEGVRFVTSSDAPVDAIFAHVVDVFNKSLPDFLARSVNPEEQKKYLFDTLDKSVKEYLAALERSVEEKARRRGEQEREKLRNQIAVLQEREAKNEEKCTESKNMQLSAERQKRALAERVHDLENKLNELEAEREQLDLEKRSLLNKIKVNSVQDGDNEALRAQIAELRTQLEEARRSQVEPLASKADEEELENLRKEIETLKSETEKLTVEVETERRKAEELKSAEAAAAGLAEQYKLGGEQAEKEKEEVSRSLAKAKEELSVKNKEINELQKRINDFIIDAKSLKDRIAAVDADKAEVETRLVAIQGELDAAKKEILELEAARHTAVDFEAVKKEKDDKISALQTQNERLENEIVSLEKAAAENSALQSAAEDGLKKEITHLKQMVDDLSGKISGEEDLKREIARLEKESARLESEVERYREKAALSQVKEPKALKLATESEPDSKEVEDRLKEGDVVQEDESSYGNEYIDELLEDTDWFTPAPIDTDFSKKHDDVSEFGYREPAKKPRQDDEAQLSLFD